MTKKIITNEQLISKLMKASQHGVLMQAFILQACEYYSALVIKNFEAGKLDIGGFIHPEAWAGCAKEYLEESQKKIKHNMS